MTAPQISPEMREAALRKARTVRRYWKAVKNALNRGELTVSAVLSDPMCQRMPVFQMLTALPGYGPAKAGKLMSRLGMMERRRIGGLKEYQRVALLKEVSGEKDSKR